MIKYIFFLFFCLVNADEFPLSKEAPIHPLIKNWNSLKNKSKQEHLKEVFNLFCKLQEKNYNSVKEFEYRMKIFRKNLNQFILSEDDVIERIKIEHLQNQKPRIIIIPDKRLSVDFNTDYDDKEEVSIFELNKFSDLTNKEFENLYLLDQSFFDEEKFPIKIEEDKNFKGIKIIQEYIDKLEKRGVKISKSLKDLYMDLPQEDMGFTPHFSTSVESEMDDLLFSESNHGVSQPDSPSNLFTVGSPRLLQAFRHNWAQGPRRWGGRRSQNRGYYPDYRRSRYGSNYQNYQYDSNNSYSQDYRASDGGSPGPTIPEGQKTMSIDGVMVPTYINWKEMGAVTEIKDQLKCNACYAFAAIGALESHYQIKTGKKVLLSEQEIVDCSRENKACVGGLPHLVFNYIRDRDISYTSDYRYDQKKYSACRRRSSTPKFDGSNLRGYTNLRRGILNLIKELSKGPVATISYASFPFKHYRGGIYRGQGCYGKTRPNHSSVLIGYKLTGKNKYLLFKNGWGTNWGNSGFYKVQLGDLSNRSQGHCMIAATRYNSIPRV